jgi:hypothetical protein
LNNSRAEKDIEMRLFLGHRRQFSIHIYIRVLTLMKSLKKQFGVIFGIQSLI